MSIYEHPPTSPNLQRALKATLPYSINLVCRTKHPNRTQHAHVLATFSTEEASIPECWVAAYFDDSMRPETDLWIFAAAEVPDHAGSSPDGKFCPKCKQLVLTLLDYLSRLEIAPLRSENQYIWDIDRPKNSAHLDYYGHLLVPHVVTLGAVHHQVVEICEDIGIVRDDFPGRGAKLNKFFFNTSDLPLERELPPGLRWGDMRAEDNPIVLASTSIPRVESTLLSLKSLGIFNEETDKPVSWAFLGLDGSLTTLTTDPKYRGKGLAKALVTKLLRNHASKLAVDDKGNAWAHADVYEGNKQSESVCRSLGGNAGAKIFWVRIDLKGARQKTT
ncbi:acetyltransferas-like protein [Periconia macrospinosa]|uniref:Acetyltransferas-like protein n=1 Tax=Periconia macrospinosa TaxID=97972 RepID=A0A2V1DZZ1_9PLEO|nr:acetyltransferas-like protein [Periconia macrospinosa]